MKTLDIDLNTDTTKAGHSYNNPALQKNAKLAEKQCCNSLLCCVLSGKGCGPTWTQSVPHGKGG